MKIIEKKEEINKVLDIKNNKRALIPTMGALHDGHFSLIKNAKKCCNTTIVSIFVNPLQFNNEDDFLFYPKTIDEDLNKLESIKVDYVYLPTLETMNIKKSDIAIDFGNMENIWEGNHRPGHFRGVGIIVTKLFNQLRPDYAFFGLKDYQQYLLIKTMVKRLDFPIKIIGIPTVRNNDGVALSSRNKRLSTTELKELKFIYQALISIKNKMIDSQSNNIIEKLQTFIHTEIEFINSQTSIKIEYFVCLNKNNLKLLTNNDLISDGILFVAAYLGDVRLIDNMFLVES